MINELGITLSNGHFFKWTTASGSTNFDLKGWWPVQRPMIYLGIVKPELTTNVVKTLSLDPIKGNYVWWHPWTCIRFIRGGTVNKVGLTNPGVWYWHDEIAPKIDMAKYRTVVSIYGNEAELVKIVEIINTLPIVAFELNDSCPNTGHAMPAVEVAVARMKAIKRVTHHPIIYKVSVNQDYLAIVDAIKELAEAVAINSVPFEIAYPDGRKSPLCKLQKQVGGGGGGVSGRPAQKENWKAVRELVKQGALPVIGPSAMNMRDVLTLESFGVSAISFGVMGTKFPWRPTRIILRRERQLKQERK